MSDYKITTDFSKVKKKKCKNPYCHNGTEMRTGYECKTCSGTGFKPIKITYKAGECPVCEGKEQYKDNGRCFGEGCDRGKLHPKVGEVFIFCPTDKSISSPKDIIGCADRITYKFLSINKEKEEAVVVRIG